MMEAIDQVAKVCHEANRAYCETLGDNSQPRWEDAPEWQKESARNGVKFHFAQHAVGVEPPPSASHEKWLEEKRAQGWTFGPVKDPTKKEHPCFVEYDELPLDQRRKDYIFGAIAKAFASSASIALFAVLLMAGMAVGQYTTTRVGYPNDITDYTTSGTNAWKYMPGNPVCQPSRPQALSVGADMSIYCFGSPTNTIFKYNLKTFAWDAQPNMGTSMVGLVVQDVNDIYGFANPCHVGTFSGYVLYKWTGSSWTAPNPGACAKNYTVEFNGNLTASGVDGNTPALFRSTDHGSTWQLWMDGYTYVNMWGGNFGCAITNTNIVQFVDATPRAPRPMPALPSGTPTGCVLAYDNSGSFIMSWNNAGTVYMIGPDETTLGWKTVAGPAIYQVSGYQKIWLLGLDGTGKPYHWNVYAKYISATTSGKYPYCASSPILCQNQTQPVHVGKLWHKFSSGHGLNYNAGIQTQTVAPNTSMNLTSWDIAPQCDPLLGHPDDPECTSDTYGSEHCNVANADLPQNPTQNPNPTPMESIAVSGFVRTRGYGGPYLTDSSTPTEGAWYGIVTRDYYDACFEFGPNEPTCPIDYSAPFNKVVLQRYHSQPESEFAQAVVQSMMEQAIMGEDMPVIIWEPYIMVNGVAQCTGTTRETESFGFRPAIPACQ